MKKIFTTLFALLIISIAIATTYTTIIIDGVNDFESDEDVAGTSSATYFITWDATNLYLGLQAPRCFFKLKSTLGVLLFRF